MEVYSTEEYDVLGFGYIQPYPLRQAPMNMACDTANAGEVAGVSMQTKNELCLLKRH